MKHLNLCLKATVSVTKNMNMVTSDSFKQILRASFIKINYFYLSYFVNLPTADISKLHFQTVLKSLVILDYYMLLSMRGTIWLPAVSGQLSGSIECWLLSGWEMHSDSLSGWLTCQMEWCVQGRVTWTGARCISNGGSHYLTICEPYSFVLLRILQ